LSRCCSPSSSQPLPSKLVRSTRPRFPSRRDGACEYLSITCLYLPSSLRFIFIALGLHLWWDTLRSKTVLTNSTVNLCPIPSAISIPTSLPAPPTAPSSLFLLTCPNYLSTQTSGQFSSPPSRSFIQLYLKIHTLYVTPLYPSTIRSSLTFFAARHPGSSGP
jgi:hypothetical protein